MKRLLPLAVLIVIISSCGKGLFSSSKSIRTEATTLNDSIQASWNKMMTDDKKKMANIKRLLDEVSYTSTHNEDELSKARALQQRTYEKTLNQNNMTSNQIDAYDSSTDSLIKASNALVNNTPELSSHTIVSTLQNDIQEEDTNVIYYRIRYDRKAKDYNKFIEEHHIKLQKLGPPYSEFKKEPLFELSE